MTGQLWTLPPNLATPDPEPTRDGLADVDQAVEFIERFHAEHPDAGPADPRLRWVRAEIELTGTYRHTSAELAFGARVAWRNSARCIGRLYWNSLRVRDLRAVHRAAEVAGHCVEHLRLATNGGRIRPTITIFAPDSPGRPGPRIWNEQLIRYAGYRTGSSVGVHDSGGDVVDLSAGGVLGDPRYADFTAAVRDLGWTPPARPGAFDVLPLVVSTQDDPVHLRELPADAVLEVPISHPDLPWLAGLGLRWHAVPAISAMRLSVGGVDYPAAPFNGWYMGTEIGARNLADADRYDLLPTIAERMGLDTGSTTSLWRDRALVELNVAVLHSFADAGVTISDHHTESDRFLKHLAKEERAGRRCPADWSWIVPPVSGGLTPVFHRYYDTDHLRPEFVTDPSSTAAALHGTPPEFPLRSPDLTPAPWAYLGPARTAS